MEKSTAKIARLVRAEIRNTAAYHVPDARTMVKLDAMENPYLWPGSLTDAWLERLREVSLNRYPDPSPAALKQRLCSLMDMPSQLPVILGNGSDELIQMIALAVAAPGRVVLAPEPGFVMYRTIAIASSMRYVGVPLLPDFSLDLPAMLAALAEHQPAVVFLAYPNNPTGNLFDANAIRAIVAASPGLVVVDEAYYPFAGKTFLADVGQHTDLLLMRTVSKMGLAGLRLGMLTGNPLWLTEIDKMRLPYNINSLTQASADFAIEHRAVLDAQAHQICVSREALLIRMRAFRELHVYPSQANFVLFRAPGGRASEIFEALKKQGILIKAMQGPSELLRDCLRVTVGTPAENDQFLSALAASL